MQSAWSGGTHGWPSREDTPHSQKRATPNKLHIMSYNAQPLPKENGPITGGTCMVSQRSNWAKGAKPKKGKRPKHTPNEQLPQQGVLGTPI